jgi:arylsulfatase A
MGWRDAGCYGSTYYQTPNIDRLANEGMLFTDGYAAAPLCAPARASLMSGKYPARLGLTRVGIQDPDANYKLIEPPQRNWTEYLDSSEITIAEVLKANGYVCGSFGKWHMGRDVCGPLNQGFDLHFGAFGGHPQTYFYPYEAGMGTYTEDGYQDIEDGSDGEYLTDRISAEAREFIEANKDNPFFVYLSHYAVHTPLMAKNELEDKYEDLADPDNPQNNPTFAAMVESVDQSVGAVMDKLEELNLTDNTAIIFTSDNDALLSSSSNLPLREGKATIFEGGIRVPFIVLWPGVIKPASRCSVPVHAVDIFPTVMDIAQITNSPGMERDGESLMPLLKQTSGIERDAIYWYYPHYILGYTPCAVVREGKYKLIKYFEDDSFRLYDIQADIGEHNDLSKSMPEKAQELNTKIDQWLSDTGAKLPTLNPDYVEQATVISNCGGGSAPYPRGDINFDCKVDGDDVRLLANNWLSSSDVVCW